MLAYYKQSKTKSKSNDTSVTHVLRKSLHKSSIDMIFLCVATKIQNGMQQKLNFVYKKGLAEAFLQIFYNNHSKIFTNSLSRDVFL
jgi:hypothetical protein